MTIPHEVADWLENEGHGSLLSHNPVSGGCISQGSILETSSGQTFFLKQNSDAPADMFASEADGLSLLNIPDGPRLPQVHLISKTFLLLEDLRPAAPEVEYWENFGRQLALLHGYLGERFGLDQDNYLGSTPQPNHEHLNGFEFFREQRLMFQAALAQRRGLLSNDDFDSVSSIASNLEHLVPEQPASLIHGDLWGGNAITGAAGEPAMIDPAAHYGWAEAELGMTMLFGGFSDRFYIAYEETRPLAPGWRERLDLYNLYHLLNHVNIFGQSYLGQVRSILRKYTNS